MPGQHHDLHVIYQHADALAEQRHPRSHAAPLPLLTAIEIVQHALQQAERGIELRVQLRDLLNLPGRGPFDACKPVQCTTWKPRAFNWPFFPEWSYFFAIAS